jgi:hypothetical protein
MIVPIKKLLFGKNRTILPRQGLRRGKELLIEEWNSTSFGSFRIFKIGILCCSFLFPIIWLDELFKKRFAVEVNFYRGSYYLSRDAFIILILLTQLRHNLIIIGVVIYFLAEILQGLLGKVFVWGTYSISDERSLLKAISNYFIVIIIYSIFYSNWVFHESILRSIYFSFIVGTTVGLYPLIDNQVSNAFMLLVVSQLSVTSLFILVFFSKFISRIRTDNVNSRKNAVFHVRASPSGRSARIRLIRRV